MFCYASEVKTQRINLRPRERSWKGSTTDCIQIGVLGMVELMAPKQILVVALKEVVANVFIKDGYVPDARSDPVFLAVSPILKQAQVCTVEKRHDMFLYGSDAKRIQAVVGASLKEAVPNGIPRIIINGEALTSTTTFTGLRTILDAKYRACHEPQAVLILLENFSGDMMMKFQSCGFRENLQRQEVRIAVIMWSCIRHGQSINPDLLVKCDTKVFVPCSTDERPWLNEDGSLKREASVSAKNPGCSQNRVVQNCRVAETTLTTGTRTCASNEGNQMNLAQSKVVYPGLATVPGPSKAEPVFLPNNGLANKELKEMSSFDKNGPNTSQKVSSSVPVSNNVQFQNPIFQQPQSFEAEAQSAQAGTKAKSMKIELGNRFEVEEVATSRSGRVCNYIVDGCKSCLVGVLVCLC